MHPLAVKTTFQVIKIVLNVSSTDNLSVSSVGQTFTVRTLLNITLKIEPVQSNSLALCAPSSFQMSNAYIIIQTNKNV